jgi:formiminoglutamate deiminase
MLRVVDGKIRLPALVTAHSHAFQRAMRGQAQRPSSETERDDFWSWREAMYRLAGELDPERFYQVARVAYEELREAGVRTVGEFHYVHHQPDGTPYTQRTLMSEVAIRAALDEGLRICLLRVVYHRGGSDQPPAGVQRRFADDSLDDALRDVEDLWSRFADSTDVRIGIAPHSVRAVPPDWLAPIASFATRRKMPLHMHVSEQPAEVEACLAETGHRPVQLVAEYGLLGPSFCGIHATHLDDSEVRLLGESGSSVCLCPTTERDLGDGLAPVGPMFEAGVQICVGIDSHVLCAPLEEIRAIELGERLRTGRRLVLRPRDQTLAEQLWHAGSQAGAEACGFDDPGGEVVLDRAASELSLVSDDVLLDAIVFGGTAQLFLKSSPRSRHSWPLDTED